jgi:hypothetical protein
MCAANPVFQFPRMWQYAVTLYTYKVILLGITSSRTRNLPEEYLFCCEVPAQGLGSHRRNGFPPGITSSWTRNLPVPEEWNSARNHQLMDADSGRQDQNARKILRTVTIQGSVVPNCFLPRMSTFLKFK